MPEETSWEFDAEKIADEILDEQRYDEDDKPFIKKLVLGARAFLRGAGAWRETNELTPTVISLIVGHWLEHRESNYRDYRDIGDFPIGMRSLITQLQFSIEEEVIVDGEA